MIPQPLQTYFFFGTCVRYLQDTLPGMGVGDTSEGWSVRTNLQQLFKYLRELNLNVSLRMPQIATLMEVYRELKKLEDSAVLTKEQAQKIRESAEALRDTLDAELSGLEAYTVTPKRYDTSLLLSGVDRIFAPGVYAKLPPMAQYDLSEAGKCIAFERPTAAAFHILRATESVLRRFYGRLVKRGGSALMWGPIVADLRTRRAARGQEALLDNLDNIRRSFRNPTQHPEATYDIHSAQDLLGLCVDAISRMTRVFP